MSVSKTHLPGCCCLKTTAYPGVTHECRCTCIQLQRGREITITGAPVEITGDKFDVEIKVPPLYRPGVEIKVETLQAKNDAGEVTKTLYVARLGKREVKIGSVVVVLNDLWAEGADKGKVVQKLCDLIGMAVVQAWADLMVSGDPDKQAAARDMEIK